MHSLFFDVYCRDGQTTKREEEWKANMIYHSKENASETTSTIGGGSAAQVFGNVLNGYAPDSFISKRALCRLFHCSERTIQRMVARRDLPSPVTVSGKRGWLAGTLGEWLADAAKRRPAEVAAEAVRLRAIMADRWNN